MVRFAPIPNYLDIFDGPKPKLEELLQDIPSRLVLELLAVISTEINLSSNIQQSSKRILALFLHRYPESYINNWFDLKNPKYLKSNTRKFTLFSTLHVLDFMHYELSNYRELEFQDTTAEQEIRILKAYFLIMDQRNLVDDKIYNNNEQQEGDFYYTHTWPILARQMEADNKVNPITEMARGSVFLNYLEFHSDYKFYSRAFLSKRGHLNSWNYILNLLNIIQSSWIRNENGDSLKARFTISSIEGYEALFESFTINPQDYKLKFNEGHKNYSGLKERPLMRVDDHTFLVLNWNFLAGKLYEGLIYDFYFGTEISCEKKFKTFMDFKKFVGEDITEKFLFRQLLKTILYKKHSVLKFDQQQDNGLPDGYYREGNKIILFEIKDAYFPSEAAMSGSFQLIKDAIDLKYNSTKKGIGQLIKQMIRLKDHPFETPVKYKRSQNLCIYPVIIYTDHLFNMPGINNYLQDELSEKIKKADLNGKFKQIRPITFIDIRFLINYLHILKQKGTDLITLMDTYQQIVVRSKKKAKKNSDLDIFLDSYPSFASEVPKEFGNLFYSKKDFVKILVDTLELTKGLPETDNEHLTH